MSVQSLPPDLKEPASLALAVLVKAGASFVCIYGNALTAWKTGDDVQIAVRGLDETQLLRATGRILMDTKLSVDLCDADASDSPFAKNTGSAVVLT